MKVSYIELPRRIATLLCLIFIYQLENDKDADSDGEDERNLWEFQICVVIT